MPTVVPLFKTLVTILSGARNSATSSTTFAAVTSFVNCWRQSQDVNEYAFALGALAHYASDMTGHPAVNHAVAMLYPKLRSKFGSSVRFAQGKGAHLKTEFGFDVAQVAKKRYASEQYHDFIGFKVSKPLLERTFPIVVWAGSERRTGEPGSRNRLLSILG